VKRDHIGEMAMPNNCQENEGGRWGASQILPNDVCDQIFKYREDTKNIVISTICKGFLEAAKNVPSIRLVHREINHENSKKKWNHGALEKYNNGKTHKCDACNNLMKDDTMQAKTPKDINVNPKRGILTLENVVNIP
jgi:hypothetical protein